MAIYKSISGNMRKIDYITNLALSSLESEECYKSGLSYLEEKISFIDRRLSKAPLYFNRLNSCAKKLKNKFKGDILRIYNNLIEYKKKSDKKGSYSIKEKYLTSYLCWAYASQECIKNNMYMSS